MSTLKVFISYSRKSDATTKSLASDIVALGYSAWFDKELSGGQTWWDQILEHIRDCQLFVLVLDPESLNSTACKREYTYAANLGKPILPVLVSEGISDNLLPQALSKIQYVDYRTQDRDAALRLARAIAAAPPATKLPDPLPSPPEVPISYLGSLAEAVETSAALSFEEQSALVVDLKTCKQTPDTSDDARMLLTRLRRRRDLYAPIADEIDSLLHTKDYSSQSSEDATATRKGAFAWLFPAFTIARSGFLASVVDAGSAKLNSTSNGQHARKPRSTGDQAPLPQPRSRVLHAVAALLRGCAYLVAALFVLGLISTLLRNLV